MITLVINILLIVVNTFYSITKKRENKVIMVISFLLLFLIMSGYRGSYLQTDLSHDMFNYSQTYKMIQNGNEVGFIEPAYKYLIIFSSRVLGLDFLTFYGIVIAVCLFVIFTLSKKYFANRHVVIALFAVFLHIYSCEQFQSFIAVVIASIALCCLLFDEKEGINYKYIFGIIIAALFHYTMILYLVFGFVEVKNRKTLIRGIAVVSIGLCILEMITGNRIDFNSILMPFSSTLDRAASRYYTVSRFGWLYGVVFQVSLIIIAYLNRKEAFRLSYYDEKQKKMITTSVERIFWINIIGIVFFPLYMVNTQLIRLSRGLLLVNFIECALILPLMDLKKRNNYMLFYLLWCIVYGYVYFRFLNGSIQSVFWPFYEKNAFF